MKIAFDLDLKRPGCPLVQAGMGGDVPIWRIGTEHWLLSPTPGMQLYEITEAQFAQLADRLSKPNA